jgi:protein-tyrosine phosphatase
MAEGLLRQKCPGLIVTSAGLMGMTGWTADPSSILIMREMGIDITAHRGRNLTEDMVNAADLILTMEAQQTHTVETRFPQSRGKVVRLGEYDDYDIADPFNRDLDFFRNTLKLIEQGVDRLIHEKRLNQRT